MENSSEEKAGKAKDEEAVGQPEEQQVDHVAAAASTQVHQAQPRSDQRRAD